MGQMASREGRAELREPNTHLIGSVAFFPERYGPDLIRVSLDILNKKLVPPAVFVEHKLVTPSTVDHFYPNDSLMQPPSLAGPRQTLQSAKLGGGSEADSRRVPFVVKVFFGHQK